MAELEVVSRLGRWLTEGMESFFIYELGHGPAMHCDRDIDPAVREDGEREVMLLSFVDPTGKMGVEMRITLVDSRGTR